MPARLIIVWVILLVILLARFTSSFVSKPQYKPGQEVSFKATLLSQPSIAGNTQRFEANGISIFIAQFPQFSYGDRLKISGKLSEAKTGNSLILYFPKIEPIKSQGFALVKIVSSLRQNIIQNIKRVLPSNEASLLLGIVLGDKEGFTNDFMNAFRNTGTLHVVAASGMNITMVSSFLMGISLLIFKRQIAAILTILGIFIYATLALFEPSIVRASIMGGIAFVALILGRQTQAVLGLALAGYIMLLFDPKLIVDIGFQLSFAATAGLIFLKPQLEEKFGWFRALGRAVIVGEGLTTTIVAQIATLPILLSNFASFSLISILVNALVLWTVPSVMVLGGLASFVNFVPFVSYPFLIASLPFLIFFESVVSFFNRPQLLINARIPFLASIGYYFLLFALYVVLRKWREKT